MSHSSPRRRKALRAGGALTLLVSTPFIWSGPATAADSTFEGTAAAVGFDLLVQNSSIAAGISPQGSGPLAQAQLTSLPSGTSFASFPYPGDVVAGVPGLAPSLVTGLPQTPAYPFLVTSGLGQGKQEINEPGIGLRAQTEETDATAHAVLGTEGSGAVSDALVRSSGGRVIAAASARQNGLSLGPQGEVATVVSEASVTRGFDGSLDRVTNLAISGLRFPGLELTLPENSPAPAPIPNVPTFPTFPLPFAGSTFVAPTLGFYNGQFTMAFPLSGNQQYAVPNDAVEKAFAAAGYDVVFTKPIETATGIVGGTFSLHFVAPAPPDNPLYAGPTDVSIVFGRASASIGGDGSASITGTGVGSAGVEGAGAAGVLGPDGLVAGGVDAAGLLPGTDGILGTADDIAVPETDGLSGEIPTANLVPATDRVRAASNSLGSGDALSNLYWVLVAAGVVAIFSAPTLRLLGARSR